MESQSVSADHSLEPLPSSSNRKTENMHDLKDLDEYDTEIDWLNDRLLSQEETSTHQDHPPLSLSSLEIKLSKLLSVLEIATSDTSTLVDKSIDEIARGVPRLNLDLQLMKENALLLRYSLKTIQSKSLVLNEPLSDSKNSSTLIPLTNPNSNENTSDETDELLSRLETLDLIKTRMESARTVLREAEAWSTLESEVTGYLTDSVPSHLKAAERLAEAAKSMVVFQHTPEYEGRRGLMRSLQNELEASLSTNLVKALSDKDVKRCKEFYEIFKMIEREGEFKNYYFGSRRSRISALWNEATISSPSLNSRSVSQSIPNAQVQLNANSLPMFLARQFFPELIKLLQSEIDFVPFIFTNPIQTLNAFLKAVLDNLKPSFSTRLVEGADSAHILASWPCLISCWNITENAGWKLESLISELDSKPKQTAESNSPILTSPVIQLSSSNANSDRRTSLKRPISRSIGSKSGSDFVHAEESSAMTTQRATMIKEWETSLYESFIDFQSNYHEREASYLRAAIKHSVTTPQNLQSNITGEKLTPSLIEKLPKMLELMFTLGDKALDRCEAFTHGYGVLGYANAVDLMFSEHIDHNRQILLTDRENRERRKENNNVGSGKSRNMQSYLVESENQILDLEGLDYSSEDWEVFQLGLKLLAMSKTVHDKLLEYEKKVTNRLSDIAHAVRSKSLDETIAMNEDLELSKIKISKGAKAILEQSTLNSKELCEFLDNLQSSERYTNVPASHGNRRESQSITTSHNTTYNKRPSAQQHVRGPSTTSQPPRSLFSKTHTSVSNLIKECQQLVQSIILLPLLKQVNDYPHMSIWIQSESELQRMNQTNSISTIDLKILNQFSKSPTEAISKLGEGLFNLPRLFEIYTTVDEDALSFSLETLPFINYFEVLSNWQQFNQSARSADQAVNSNQAEKNHQPILSSEMVVSTWLSSLTLAVVNQFSQNISDLFILDPEQSSSPHQISSAAYQPSKIKLSSSARTQLSLDLDYLCNVVRALDVETDVLDKLRNQVER